MYMTAEKAKKRSLNEEETTDRREKTRYIKQVIFDIGYILKLNTHTTLH